MKVIQLDLNGLGAITVSRVLHSKLPPSRDKKPEIFKHCACTRVSVSVCIHACSHVLAVVKGMIPQ